MDLRFAGNNGNIQVIVRRIDDSSFYLVVATSNAASVQAWGYYLKIITLLHRSSSMFGLWAVEFLCS